MTSKTSRGLIVRKDQHDGFWKGRIEKEFEGFKVST